MYKLDDIIKEFFIIQKTGEKLDGTIKHIYERENPVYVIYNSEYLCGGLYLENRDNSHKNIFGKRSRFIKHEGTVQ